MVGWGPEGADSEAVRRTRACSAQQSPASSSICCGVVLRVECPHRCADSTPARQHASKPQLTPP